MAQPLLCLGNGMTNTIVTKLKNPISKTKTNELVNIIPSAIKHCQDKWNNLDLAKIKTTSDLFYTSKFYVL